MTSTLTRRIDPIKTALGVFVTLGVVLTGVAAYAVASTTGVSASVSPGAAVALLSGVSLVAFVALSSSLLGRRSRRSA